MNSFPSGRAAAVTRQRRFLFVGVTALAVLGAALGVSFAGDTGGTTVAVNSSSTNFVFPVGAGLASPAPIAALKYTGTSGIVSPNFSGTAANVIVPKWAPVAGSAGGVTTAGDIVVFDATTATLADHTSLRVTVFVTNLDKLQQAYSSFAFPVNVYRCASTCTTTGAWTQASAVIASPPTYLTNTDGFVSFTLPGGYYYDLAFDTGGSFYTVSTATAANLNPSFYFTALPL